MGYSKKNTTRNSSQTNFRKKQSEYATQLKEKQKVKFIYGVLERQFSNYFEEAARRPGQTGENLLQMLECRLDNVVFRLGFASTRRDARQLVSHAHFTVNGKKVNIPSYQVKAGDVIEVRESSRSSAKFAKLVGPEAAIVAMPAWLTRETGTLKGVVAKLPERSDIDYEVAEHRIVELYSK
jgi:small subunit ribosomal protein S4